MPDVLEVEPSWALDGFGVSGEQDEYRFDDDIPWDITAWTRDHQAEDSDQLCCAQPPCCPRPILVCDQAVSTNAGTCLEFPDFNCDPLGDFTGVFDQPCQALSDNYSPFPPEPGECPPTGTCTPPEFCAVCRLEAVRYKFVWDPPLEQTCTFCWAENTFELATESGQTYPINTIYICETVAEGETESSVYEIQPPAGNPYPGQITFVGFPAGACCDPVFGCYNTDNHTCATVGDGIYQGDSCAPDPCSEVSCPDPTHGGCCIDGTCFCCFSEGDCTDAGGTFFGIGETCFGHQPC